MAFICDLIWAEKLSMKQNRNHHNNYENNNYISKKFFACMTLLNFFVDVARIKKSNATYIVWYHTFRVLGKLTIRRMRLKLQLLYSNTNGTWKTIMFICLYNITRVMWLEILLIGQGAQIVSSTRGIRWKMRFLSGIAEILSQYYVFFVRSKG